MKVKELIEKLKNCNQEAEVLLMIDDYDGCPWSSVHEAYAEIVGVDKTGEIVLANQCVSREIKKIR